MKLQHVHLRIADAETQKSLPCRVRCTDVRGQYYAPLGRLADFHPHSTRSVGGNLALAGSGLWAYVEGDCEILLPPGDIRIQAVHGLEYEPLDTVVTHVAGKLSIRLTMKRWKHHEGWCSADTRILHMSPSAVLLEARAEDVRVANLLGYQTTERDATNASRLALPNLLDFSGQGYALEKEGVGVAVNTWNQAELGSMGLLHCHRVVHPLRIGGDDVDWTLDDLVDQCHRKKGLAVWSDVAEDEIRIEGSPFHFGEALLPTIAGKVNAFEIAGRESTRSDRLQRWYTLLNAGLCLALVGTGAKRDNTGVVGGMRTLTQTSAASYSSWVDACLFGKTIVTNGPLLEFTVDGKGPHTANRSMVNPVKMVARAESSVAFELLEIVHNGEVLAATNAREAFPYSAAIELETKLTQGGWLAARCRGSQRRPDVLGEQTPFAHTSPIYVGPTEGNAARVPTAVAEIEREFEHLATWIDSHDTPAQPRARLRDYLQQTRKAWKERFA